MNDTKLHAAAAWRCTRSLALILAATAFLLSTPLSALPKPGGGGGGGGKGGGGASADVLLCVDFRDHSDALTWIDRLQSDGQGSYCDSKQAKVEAYLSSAYGNLYLRTHERGDLRKVWVDLGDCNTSISSSCSASDAGLWDEGFFSTNAEYVLTGGAWTPTGSNLDIAAMDPGEVKYCGAQSNYVPTGAGDVRIIRFGPDSLAPQASVLRVERTDDGSGGARTWTVGVMQVDVDDTARVTPKGSGAELGYYHLPFEILLTEQP